MSPVKTSRYDTLRVKLNRGLFHAKPGGIQNRSLIHERQRREAVHLVLRGGVQVNVTFHVLLVSEIGELIQRDLERLLVHVEVIVVLEHFKIVLLVDLEAFHIFARLKLNTFFFKKESNLEYFSFRLICGGYSGYF